jgi:hypothetical protein
VARRFIRRRSAGSPDSAASTGSRVRPGPAAGGHGCAATPHHGDPVAGRR